MRTFALIALALLMSGCASLPPSPRQAMTLALFERRADGSVTSATMTGTPHAVFGEHRTSATLEMGGVKVVFYDEKTKDTLGNLGAAGIGALAGWLVLP